MRKNCLAPYDRNDPNTVVYIYDFANFHFTRRMICLPTITSDVFCDFLKVHKIENFLDSDFEICIISLLVMNLCINNKGLVKHFFDCTIMGGATIIPRNPRTTRNEKNFQDRPKNFCF